MSRPQRQRTDRGIDNVAAGLNRLHQRDQRDAGGGVGVDMNQHVLAALLLDAFDQVIGGLRLQQAGHVLDANRIAPHLLQLLRHLGKGRNGMQRTDGVTDRALRVLAGLFHGVDAGLEVAHVVERVKNAEYVHAVGRRPSPQSARTTPSS